MFYDDNIAVFILGLQIKMNRVNVVPVIIKSPDRNLPFRHKKIRFVIWLFFKIAKY